MNIRRIAKVAGFTLPPLAIIVVPETVIHKVLEFIQALIPN